MNVVNRYLRLYNFSRPLADGAAILTYGALAFGISCLSHLGYGQRPTKGQLVAHTINGIVAGVLFCYSIRRRIAHAQAQIQAAENMEPLGAAQALIFMNMNPNNGAAGGHYCLETKFRDER